MVTPFLKQALHFSTSAGTPSIRYGTISSDWRFGGTRWRILQKQEAGHDQVGDKANRLDKQASESAEANRGSCSADRARRKRGGGATGHFLRQSLDRVCGQRDGVASSSAPVSGNQNRVDGEEDARVLLGWSLEAAYRANPKPPICTQAQTQLRGLSIQGLKIRSVTLSKTSDLRAFST